MKRLLILTLAAATLGSCGSPNKYTIEGNVPGLNETVYLYDEVGNKIDSTTAKEGVFRFKGIAENPTINAIGTGEESESPFSMGIFIEPGTITVSETEALGTPANDAGAAFDKSARTLIERFRDPAITPQERAALDEEFSAMGRKALEENQNNLFGVVILAQQMIYEMRPTELLEAIAKFPESLQQSELMKKVKEAAEAKQRTEVGTPYIDIVQNNAEGQPVSLKSVIDTPTNTYVLVDFWASWCKPCMAEVPYLTADYAKYKAKGFEIYGVSFDTDKEKWMAAVKDNKLNWIHVSDLRRFDNQAARDYAVNSIPANFLVDCSTDKIVAVNLRGEELGKKLAELLD